MFFCLVWAIIWVGKFIKNVFGCHIKKKLTSRWKCQNVENHCNICILWEVITDQVPRSYHFVLFVVRRCSTVTNRPAKKKCTCLWEPRTTGNRIWTTCAPSKWPFRTRTTIRRFSTKWCVYYSYKMIWYRAVAYIYAIVQWGGAVIGTI